MNLILTILSGGQPGRHVFGAEGGRFGRSQKCDWVLSDPDCILSSVHGRIHLVNGTFLLVDESTNGIFIGSSNEPLGKGNSVIATDGLRFRAGTYQIEVRLAQDQVARMAGTQPMGYEPPPIQAQPARQQQPLYAQPQPAYQPQQMMMPQAVSNQSRADDALRQNSEYGDLWRSNSQDPLAYLDGTASAPPSHGLPQHNARAAGAIPAGFYPEFPEGNSLPGLPMPPLGQPSPYHQPVHQQPAYQQPVYQEPGPSPVATPVFSQHASPYDSLPGGQLRGYAPAGNGVSQPEPDMGYGQDNGQRPAERGGIPDDFFSRLTPAASRPANPMPMVSPAPAPFEPPVAIPNAATRATIPDNFDPFSSLGFGAPKARVTEPMPAAIPIQRVETPPAPPRFETPAAMPAMPPMPEMVVPPVVERPRPVEQLSPALMADVIKIEPPAVLPERRAVAVEKASFDPLEALRSRREERTAALERKARVQTGLPEMAVPAAIPAALPLQQAGVAALPAMASLPLPSVAANGKDAAVAALFRGMGFPASVALPAEGEKVAESVGLMVRAISEGLVQLLSARQMLKSEFRMDETQMRPEENNPFKYYKIAELALDELFVTRSGGFQDPAEAAATAFADIQQYVMLTTSAIQRAMTLMFQRLSPEAIARDAEGDGGMRIRGLGGGKGKWETYVDSHARMSGRLDGITRQIISEAFAQVQEEQARKTASEYWEKKK